MLHISQTIYKGLVIIFFCLCIGGQTNAWGDNYGIVLSNRLNIRPSPNLKNQPIGLLYKGMRVLVIQTQKDWVKIKHLGKMGYVNRAFIEVIGFEPAVGKTTVDRLNFRPIAGTSLPPIGKLGIGSKVHIISADTKWLFIRHNNQIGYVARQYVKILPEQNIDNVIKANEPNKPQSSTEFHPDSKQHNQIHALKQEKQEIKQKISEKKAQLKRASKKEQDIIQELDDVDRSINEYSMKLSALSTEIAAIDKKISSTKHKSEILLKKISETETYVNKRLVALYKLKRIGASQIFYHADSFSDIFASYKYLSYILNHDNQMRVRLMTDKKHLENLFADLRKKRSQKKEMQHRVSDIHAHMQSQKIERSNILKDIQNQKHLAAKAVSALKQSANKLDQTIDDIRIAIIKNKQKKVTFKKNRSKMRLPVKGKVINKYGKYTNEKLGITRFRNGVYIIAEKGEPIKAVCPGRILYAEWFKGYGNMIIIDHGDSYYTVYAHADEIFKQKGEPVEKGEVVGTLGETGSMVGPGLYFEVRHHGKPINPIKWLKES